ncbi:MAG: hypothetical protein ACRCTK_01550 [Alphaproteobacteria bacterium]
MEFRQTLVEPESLKDLLSHSRALENLSFSSCFMSHDFLKKIEPASFRFKKLSLSQVGFFADPNGSSAADYIPGGATELSIFSCYKVVASKTFHHEEDLESYHIEKLGHFVGVPWLAERTTGFPNLERLTIQEPELCLENLASCPVDRIFRLSPQLNFFELSSCYYTTWYEPRYVALELDHLTSAQQYKKKKPIF